MTDENKTNILNYITGDYQTTSPSNEEIFIEQGQIDGTNWDILDEIDYIQMSWGGMIAPNETTTPLGVLYGGYLNSSGNYGLIVLVDQDMNPVKVITEYDSGTKLRFIQRMAQAEDGTFYFIDDTAFFNQNQQSITSQKRFVMVNNFTLETNGDYKIHLRTSYIFSGDYVNFFCRQLFKDPNSSHYIFFGSATNTTSPYSRTILKIFGLKVNVGEANEWTMYANDSARILGSAIATFSGGNVRYRCIVTNNLLANNDIMLYSKTYTGSATSSTMLTFDNYKPYINTYNYDKQAVFLDYDNLYFVQNNQQWGTAGVSKPKYIGLYKYNIANSTLRTIYEKYLGDYDFCTIEYIYVDRCNTDIYIQYNNNITDTGFGNVADYSFQRLVNDTWNPIKIAEQKDFTFNYRTMYIKANYNLLQAYLISKSPNFAFWYLIKEDYNSFNYNSTEYNDYSSMIGSKGRVYSNGKLVFARNLYNRTQWNNTTTSTIQIPNSYLNGITMQPKQLLAYSNSIVNNDTTELTKNIYESVLLNFVNSISVVDEDTQTTYLTDASYINNNINVGTQSNSEETMISKVKINYEDGSVIQNIAWVDISDSTTIAKQTQFTIYVSSAVTSIDFLSDDENFVYLTKEYQGLQTGKYYTISQKIRIE